MSRARAQQLVEGGFVRVEDRVVRPGYRLRPGERVAVYEPPAQDPAETDAALPALDVLYEDEDIIAVNKPARIVTHPGPGHGAGTLAQAVLRLAPEVASVGTPDRPGIVHRLDRDTTGVLLVARTAAAHADLQAQFAQRTVRKRYLALVEGAPDPPAAIIDAPLTRAAPGMPRIELAPGGRAARSRYFTLAAGRGSALLAVDLFTGRTHQARVHLAAVGHPIVGDRTYGHASEIISRQALHAWLIAVRSPSRGGPVCIESSPPADLQAASAAAGIEIDRSVEDARREFLESCARLV